MGSGTFVEGFEEQLIGAKVNEETEVNLVMPEDYPAENWQAGCFLQSNRERNQGENIPESER